MGHGIFEITFNTIKLVVIFLMMVQLVPILVWVERRGSAFIQNRFGPNRVGPLGLMQLLADAVKFLAKEGFMPLAGRELLYYAAPVLAIIPGAVAFSSIPLSIPFELKVGGVDHLIPFQGFHLSMGIVFVMGVSSLGAYSLLLAGWSSANKYSLFGALRASAQMISYELAMGLSVVGVMLIYGSFDFDDMIRAQQGPLSFTFMGKNLGIWFLPNWGIFYQPLGFILFFASTFAETNRLPFDLPEAEAELVAGYHTEYGGLKMLMFYIGEYGHMMVASALATTFYFGGYDIPFVSAEMMKLGLSGVGESLQATLGFLDFGASNWTNILAALFFHVWFLTKVLFFLWVFIWVRWTLPRFRYDQLMDLGWKSMLPWALLNTVITAVIILIAHTPWGA